MHRVGQKRVVIVSDPETMNGAYEVRLELRSNPLYLSGARELVGAIARRLGFPDEHASQIALALDEALCNVIRHGYDRETGKPIWISLIPRGLGPEAGPEHARQADALTLIIEDEAPQVEPDKIRSRDLDEVRPGGLGVHIIQSVMDEVRYEQRDPIGMRLVMTKRRPGAGVASADAAAGRAGATGGGGASSSGGSGSGGADG